VHLELHGSSSDVLVLRTTVGGLGVHCASIGKERFIVEVIFLTVGIAGFQPSGVIEQSLIVHHFLVGGLRLSQRDLFTDIPFFLLYLFLPFPAHFFHALFAFDLPHSVVPELLAFLCLSVFVFFPFVLVLLDFFVFLPRFKGSPSEFFFFFEVLFVVHAPLYLGSFFQFDFGLSLRDVERVDDICEVLVDGVMLQGASVRR
jgi:hypothetical protein